MRYGDGFAHGGAFAWFGGRSSMELMLRQVHKGAGEVVIASHNEQSVIKAMKIMEGLGMPNMHTGVMFGQLQGMCDFLTYSLSAKGYQAYK